VAEMEDQLADCHDEYTIFKESIVERMENKLDDAKRIKADLEYKLQTTRSGGELIFLFFVILLYFFFSIIESDGNNALKNFFLLYEF
jgi:hypothetical protein